MSRMWMVRAEVGGRYFADFKERSLVAVGRPEVGDLRQYQSREALTDKLRAAWPDWHLMRIAMSAGTLHRFRHELKNGEHVVTYDPSRRVYLVGKIAGDYRHDAETIPELPNVRPVSWEGEVNRDQLAVATKNSLGAISTLFEVPPQAREDMLRALRGEKDGGEMAADAAEEDVQVEELLKDLRDRSNEFIKDQVSQLDWQQLQELVAGLLRAMGYKTQVSPAGPDRGRDIIASPDGFGFESPRIVVEVKHRPTTAIGSQDIRSFIGGRHKDDKGLYVSTGGFTKDSHYEAERANIPLTLLDLDGLVQAVLDQYENLDITTQRLLPLAKVYWPA